jgi:hypothetical protein
MYVDAFSMVCIRFFFGINGVTLGPKIQYFWVLPHGNLLHRACFLFIFSVRYSLPLIFSTIGRKIRSTNSTLDASPSCGFFAKGEMFMANKYLNHECM